MAATLLWPAAVLAAPAGHATPAAPAAYDAPAAPAGAGAPAAPAVPLDAYVAALETARSLAEQAAPPSTERMDDVRTAAGLPARVSLPGGGTVDVPADTVLARLAGRSAEDFGAAAERLRVLGRAARAAADAPAHDAAAVRDALEASFRGIRSEAGVRDRIWQWIALQFGRVSAWFRWLADRAPVLTDVLRWGGVVVAAVVVLLLAVRLLRQLGLVPGGNRHAGRAGAERVDWARAAEAALARGDTRDAVRALYRLLVELLAQRGLVPDSPSLTPAECRSALRRAGGAGPTYVAADLLGAVDRATSAFERIVYGRAPASAADVEVLRDAGRAAMAA